MCMYISHFQTNIVTERGTVGMSGDKLQAAAYYSWLKTWAFVSFQTATNGL